MPNRGTQQPQTGRQNPGLQAPADDDEATEIEDQRDEGGEQMGAQSGKRSNRQDQVMPDDSENIESEEDEADEDEEDGSGGRV